MSAEGLRLPDRPADLRDRPVAAWSELVVIPTYPELAPDRLRDFIAAFLADQARNDPPP